MQTNVLDNVLSRLTARTSFFEDGWGDRSVLERTRETGAFFGDHHPPIEMTWGRERNFGRFTLRRGTFTSPMAGGTAPFPVASHLAYVEQIMPRGATLATPVCLHFASTGDEGFARRRWSMAIPLAKRGIGALILENPFYGCRRPPGQVGWSIRRVDDFWTMAFATLAEGRGLVRWLAANGVQRIGVTGISMGGFMAAACASLESRPLAVIPCLAPHSAVPVFTEGALSRACAWDILQQSLEAPLIVRQYLGHLLEVTDLRRMTPPMSAPATILVAAKRDGFVPTASTHLLHQHWPGSELRWVDSGHAGAFLFHRQEFHRAIIDAFARLG